MIGLGKQYILQEEFEDTKEVIRIRISKKNSHMITDMFHLS
jgi:hypothetical protein